MWLLPDEPLSASALALRQLWADRWQGTDPHGRDHKPSGALADHLDAYPDFRCPLSQSEERLASAEFHAEAIRRLAVDETGVILMTFDWEWTYHLDGEHGQQTSQLAGLLDREPWLSLISEPEDEEDTVVTHVFMTPLALDDLRLAQVWNQTANGEASVLVTNPSLEWLAWPIEEHLNVLAFNPDTLTRAREVEQDTWSRWGIMGDRQALLDLAEVSAYFEKRRDDWERRGVRPTMGPQYRHWKDGQVDVQFTLPDDLTNTDWFFIRLSSASAEASVVVYDTGTCTVLPCANNEADDDALDALIGRSHQHAGELDLAGIIAVFEEVVDALATSPPQYGN